MAKLKIFEDKKLISEIDLTTLKVRIGRRPENEVSIAEPTVSRHHATLVYHSERYFWQIENLSKKNPVRVNGQIVREISVLFDEDQINVGKATLVFEDDG